MNSQIVLVFKKKIADAWKVLAFDLGLVSPPSGNRTDRKPRCNCLPSKSHNSCGLLFDWSYPNALVFFLNLFALCQLSNNNHYGSKKVWIWELWRFDDWQLLQCQIKASFSGSIYLCRWVLLMIPPEILSRVLLMNPLCVKTFRWLVRLTGWFPIEQCKIKALTVVY